MPIKEIGGLAAKELFVFCDNKNVQLSVKSEAISENSFLFKVI